MIHGTSTGSAAWLLVSLAVTVGGLGSVLTTVGEPIARAPQARGAGNRDQDRRARFTHDGTVDDERGNGKKGNPDEAATGFDNLTNGFDLQGSPFESLTADSRCCAENPSTTIDSSSRRSRRPPMVWDRPTTRRAAGSVTRTS